MLLLGVLICECFAHARTLLFLHCACHMSLTAAFRLFRKEKKSIMHVRAVSAAPVCSSWLPRTRPWYMQSYIIHMRLLSMTLHWCDWTLASNPSACGVGWLWFSRKIP